MTREEDPPAGQGREGAASMRLCLEANDPSDHIGDGSAAQYAAFDQPGVFIDNPRPTVRPPSGARSRRVRVPPAQWQAVVSGYNLYCQEWSWAVIATPPRPTAQLGGASAFTNAQNHASVFSFDPTRRPSTFWSSSATGRSTAAESRKTRSTSAT